MKCTFFKKWNLKDYKREYAKLKTKTLEQHGEIEEYYAACKCKDSRIKRTKKALSKSEAQNKQLKDAIRKYGKGADFDWDILGKISELEEGLSRAIELLEELSKVCDPLNTAMNVDLTDIKTKSSLTEEIKKLKEML